MERTFTPMGVASTRSTRAMPGASTDSTCPGSGVPASDAFSPATRLSSTSVVFPEPDTPVTQVRRPFGMRASSGCTVWMVSVSSVMAPSSKRCSGATGVRTRTFAVPAKNGPMRLAGFASTAATDPWAITCPPSAPEPGPISMRWFAWRSTATSWSTITTELPSDRRSSMTPSSPSMFAGCSPMEGSSST